MCDARNSHKQARLYLGYASMRCGARSDARGKMHHVALDQRTQMRASLHTQGAGRHRLVVFKGLVSSMIWATILRLPLVKRLTNPRTQANDTDTDRGRKEEGVQAAATAAVPWWSKPQQAFGFGGAPPRFCSSC